VCELAQRFDKVQGAVGFAFPSVVRHGVMHTAAHVDSHWIGTNGETLIGSALGRPVAILNDADAAGLAEMELGAGRGCRGTVLLLTFGTGIGSALFVDGVLVPNTELGHLRMAGGEAEELASGFARTRDRLGWEAWAERVNAVLAELHRLLWPDVFILGGGVTEAYEKFSPLLSSRAELRPARFRAHAGIVGAALAAAHKA
jgi:polyphosphate glucokinase